MKLQRLILKGTRVTEAGLIEPAAELPVGAEITRLKGSAERLDLLTTTGLGQQTGQDPPTWQVLDPAPTARLVDISRSRAFDRHGNGRKPQGRRLNPRFRAYRIRFL